MEFKSVVCHLSFWLVLEVSPLWSNCGSIIRHKKLKKVISHWETRKVISHLKKSHFLHIFFVFVFCIPTMNFIGGVSWMSLVDLSFKQGCVTEKMGFSFGAVVFFRKFFSFSKSMANVNSSSCCCSFITGLCNSSAVSSKIGWKNISNLWIIRSSCASSPFSLLRKQAFYYRLLHFSDPVITTTTSWIFTNEKRECHRLEPGTFCDAVARFIDCYLAASESVFSIEISRAI